MFSCNFDDWCGIHDFRQYILELKQRADQIAQNQAKQPTAQVQSVGYDTQSLISEMRDGLNHVKQHYGQVIQKLAEKQTCPSVTCVNITTVLVVAALQLVIILGYLIYR